MPAAPLSDEDMLEALRAYFGNDCNVTEAAKALGLPRPTYQHRLDRAQMKYPDSKALRAELEGRVADGYRLPAYTHQTTLANGDKVWLKPKVVEQDYWAGIEKALGRIEPVKNIKPLKAEPQSDIIPWLQIGDAHIGMLASEEETGANFDISIGEREICAAAAALIEQAPPCERMVVNDLGDGSHYETFKALTEASGNPVDYDTRYWKMIDAYIRITQFIIERALEKAQTVDYIANQGNHSRSNDIWIAATVRALYGPTGRVNVLPNANVIVPYRMGDTFVLIHHGDRMKPERLRNAMASDYPQDWGESRFRYIDGGHVHHSQRKELEGCLFESWNNLAPADKHAHDGGWRSRQCMTLVNRSRRFGEVGRAVMPIERVRDIILEKHPDHYVPPVRRAFAA